MKNRTEIIGDHKLIMGDCLEVMAELGLDAVVTDGLACGYERSTSRKQTQSNKSGNPLEFEGAGNNTPLLQREVVAGSDCEILRCEPGGASKDDETLGDRFEREGAKGEGEREIYPRDVQHPLSEYDPEEKLFGVRGGSGFVRPSQGREPSEPRRGESGGDVHGLSHQYAQDGMVAKTKISIVTDPPYGMDFQSNYRKERHLKIQGDTGIDHLILACNLPVNYSRYVFCRWDNLREVPPPKSCITWVKNNWSMGDLEHEHARQTEIILFYLGPEHRFPRGRPQDVVRFPRTGNEWHPSEKPVGLLMEVIGWTEGAILDPFMGSGTTGVACANLGRKFIGIEIEEKYFDIACRRIEQAASQIRMDFDTPKPTQEGLKFD